jgi:hypothetical protein
MIGSSSHFLSTYSISMSLFRLVGFALHRYSSDHPIPASTLSAWQLLGNSVYKQNVGGSHSLMLYRPGLDRGQSVSYIL